MPGFLLFCGTIVDRSPTSGVSISDLVLRLWMAGVVSCGRIYRRP